jgi:hypothetical protein
MNTMKILTALAIATAAVVTTAAPSNAYTQRAPAGAGTISSNPHTTTGSGFRLPASCHPYKPGCMHIPGDNPGAPKKTGNGGPNNGLNCTYTTHGLCSPD